MDWTNQWTKRADGYASEIASDYHAHRLEVIGTLLPNLQGKSVVDFGCGEGVLIRKAREAEASSVVGIDPVPDLLRRAKDATQTILGGVEQLALIPDASVDCLIAANVLAYLTPEEERTFYREAARIVRGALVVTHSNELFDLFTLNSYTTAFFVRYFGVDVASLLAMPDKPKDVTFNIRENPLTYGTKLSSYGFTVERMEFMNRHPVPPLLTGAAPSDIHAKTYPPTLGLPESERWKLLFQCSMFGVRAVIDRRRTSDR
jgi:SAM-dependent methyltransferase